MSVEIKKVESKKDLKTFVDFHYDLYEGNAYDVPTLFSDDMATLSRDKNAAFEFCEAEYYLAYKDGKLVGRVAAIINNKANKRWGRKTCRFGWIDFIDDLEVSKALLDTVAEYGKSKGMTEVVGPLGFTDFDPEGMLTEGYDQLGTFATIYNYPYYPQHMEKLGGWVKDNDYVEFKIFVPDAMPEKHLKIAQMVEKRYNLHVHVMTKHEVYKEGKGIEVFKVINEAFKDIYGFSELSDKQKRILSDYDNSLLYNDSILEAITQRFADKDALVIYMPDHGEEIFDGSPYMYGRMHGANIDYRLARNEMEIPFWIWGAPKYRENHPYGWQAIKEAKDRPMMTDVLPHLLLYLGGISTPLYRSEYNVISPDYNTQRPRILKGVTDYNKLKR